MHSQKDALKILNCDKSTLSRYVNKGKLKRVKKGKRTFYDEHEVAILVLEIEKKQKKNGTKIKPKEKIELQQEDKKDFEDKSIFQELTPLGMELLATATKDLKELGIYEECDKQILLMYALSGQMFSHFGSLALQVDGVTTTISGNQTLHPYHKMMQYHEKQMLAYSDRLGLNPASRTKLTSPKKEKVTDIMEIINEK